MELRVRLEPSVHRVLLAETEPTERLALPEQLDQLERRERRVIAETTVLPEARVTPVRSDPPEHKE